MRIHLEMQHFLLQFLRELVQFHVPKKKLENLTSHMRIWIFNDKINFEESLKEEEKTIEQNKIERLNTYGEGMTDCTQVLENLFSFCWVTSLLFCHL